MRLEIVLQPPLHQTTTLPANYQFQLAAWLSKLLNNPSAEFMQRLHQNAYLQPNETKFDAFTFSPLQANDEKYVFTLSLCVDNSFEYVLKSIFYEQSIDFKADNDQITPLSIWTISRLPDPNWDKDDLVSLRFRCVSPLYLHRKDNTADIVQPNQRGFKTKLLGNLVDKFLALRHYLPATEQQEHTPAEPPPTTYVAAPIEQMPTAMPQWQSVQPVRQTISKRQSWLKSVLPSNVVYAFKLLSEPKTVVLNNNNEIKNIPMLYEYIFELTAPTQLLRVGYEAGFGENTSMGFGFVEAINEQQDLSDKTC